MNHTRPCKRCGRQIVFVKNKATGKTIPLDAAAHVYRLNEDGTCERVAHHYTTHFQTCPAAGEFSKGRKP